jgi:hypothetical protein
MKLDDCTNILYSSSVTFNRAEICNIFMNIFAPVHMVQHVRETIYAVASKRRLRRDIFIAAVQYVLYCRRSVER